MPRLKGLFFKAVRRLCISSLIASVGTAAAGGGEVGTVPTGTPPQPFIPLVDFADELRDAPELWWTADTTFATMAGGGSASHPTMPVRYRELSTCVADAAELPDLCGWYEPQPPAALIRPEAPRASIVSDTTPPIDRPSASRSISGIRVRPIDPMRGCGVTVANLREGYHPYDLADADLSPFAELSAPPTATDHLPTATASIAEPPRHLSSARRTAANWSLLTWDPTSWRASPRTPLVAVMPQPVPDPVPNGDVGNPFASPAETLAVAAAAAERTLELVLFEYHARRVAAEASFWDALHRLAAHDWNRAQQAPFELGRWAGGVPRRPARAIDRLSPPASDADVPVIATAPDTTETPSAALLRKAEATGRNVW